MTAIFNAGNSFQIKLLENEYWWGGCVTDGPVMPFSCKTEFTRNLTVNPTGNQAQPLLLSSKGRYVWSSDGFIFTFSKGTLTVEGNPSDLIFEDDCNTLKGAFQKASRRHFPPSGQCVPDLFFTKPQYNTWIELMYNQNQQGILEYAENILKNGMPAGIIMIDCGWQEYYGRLKFHPGRFPSPKEMITRLHEMGFAVMLWECPFISPDSSEYRYLRNCGMLLKNRDGSVAIRAWWDGYSAVLDMTNPAAVEWLLEQNRTLTDVYGADGFKLDAGDAYFYRDDDITFAPTSANGHSELWAKFGLHYPLNEYRACWKCAGQPLVQRLCDKAHSWDLHGGVASLVPSELAQGILGYAFTCPDMIGGGEYMNFTANMHNLDAELFVRYAQNAALMPMMQFSAAPWRVLDKQHFALCREAGRIHEKYADYITELARDAAATGEPIVRYMEYEYPDSDLECVSDQFMLGDQYLVAPVCQKGAAERTVYFPPGQWHDWEGNIITGGKGVCHTVAAPLDHLPIFKKV